MTLERKLSLCNVFLSFLSFLYSKFPQNYSFSIDSMQDDILTIEILEHSDSASRQSNQFNSIEKTEENSTPQVVHKRSVPTVSETAASADVSSDDEEVAPVREEPKKKYSGQLINTNFHGSKGALPSPLGSTKSFDLQVANWRMEKLEMESKSGSDEEFYDCLGESKWLCVCRLCFQ